MRRSLLLAILGTVSIFLIGIPSGPASEHIQLEKVTYYLPGDGTPNNNQQIGPFCCTGHTATIRTVAGDPVGYIYAFSWEGQAYNIGGGQSVAPSMRILVSGATDLSNPDSTQQESSMVFWARRTRIGESSESTQAGRLCFTAIIDNADRKNVQGGWHFVMGSVVARVDVTICEPRV